MLHRFAKSLVPSFKRASVFNPVIVKNYSTVENKDFLNEVEKKSHFQRIRKVLENDPRFCIPYEEYLKIAKEAKISEQEARELSEYFHKAAVFYHFKDNPSLNDVMIIKPEVVTANLYTTINVDIQKKLLEKKIQEADALEKELQPLREQKALLDKKAKKRVNAWWWLGGAYLTGQMSFFAYLTWIKYGWDVVEPITYMTTFSVVLISYLYFTAMNREYTYSDAHTYFVKKRALKEYAKANFNVQEYLQKEQQLADLKKAIEHESKLLWGQLPKTFYENPNLETLLNNE